MGLVLLLRKKKNPRKLRKPLKTPTSKAELQEIEQMTHLRVEKYGAHLLPVCKDFNIKRLNYLGKIFLIAILFDFTYNWRHNNLEIELGLVR